MARGARGGDRPVFRSRALTLAGVAAAMALSWPSTPCGAQAVGPAAAAPPVAPSRLDTLVLAALDTAVSRYVRAAARLDPGSGYPRYAEAGTAWHASKLSEWTSGFFPAALWSLYGLTGDARLRSQAERWTAPLPAIFRGRYSHDLGFQFFTTNAQAYRLTGDARYRTTALEAARLLAGRFDARVGAIRSWDWMAPARPFPVIADNMMNLELLFWSARNGGGQALAEVARRHARTTLANHVRADGGSFHVVAFDTATGRPLERFTHQGYADSSTWSRGEAWLLYGFTMANRESADPEFLAAAQRIASYYLAHLPGDGVPCWDFQAPGCPGGLDLRDASAAAVGASALLELSQRVRGETGRGYLAAAERTLATLSAPPYLAPPGSDALLLHATGNRPARSEVDVSLVYADYYFIEALLRYAELRGLLPPGAGARAWTEARLWSAAAPATILLRGDALLRARDLARAGSAALAPALERLRRDADSALAVAPVSVVEKHRTAPSGDRHDYVSSGPYWWPDPSRPGGVPYVRRDGRRNPDAARDSDSPRLARMNHAVQTLALAYWFTGDDRYARHAATLLRTWFVDPATRMNPNLEFGQGVPGRWPGRGAGIIDTHLLPWTLDAVRLIESSPAWTRSDGDALREWVTAYLRWLGTSRNGLEERRARNNHGSWYDVQTADFALFVGNTTAARQAIERGKTRIGEIARDGRQPRELARTRSLNYSAFNIDALTSLAELARHQGVDLWRYTAPSGGSIQRALDYLAPYASLSKPWPGQQITPQSPDFLLVQLLRAAWALDRPEYRTALESIPAAAGRDSPGLLVYPLAER